VSDPVLQADGLYKSFGALCVSDNVCFELGGGECLALIGPNGAGKTTLINQLSGFVESDAGAIRFAGRDITHLSPDARARAGLARSFQITSVIPSFSVLENVALAVQARAGSSFRIFGRAAGERALNDEAMAALARVRLDDRALSPAGSLSHGEKRVLELAIALAMKPKALLLDEPMAGMGREESQQLVALLADLKATCPMLLVEHDMDAVFALADRVAVLVYGRIIAVGTPDEIRANAEVKAAYLGEDAA